VDTGVALGDGASPEDERERRYALSRTSAKCGEDDEVDGLGALVAGTGWVGEADGVEQPVTRRDTAAADAHRRPRRRSRDPVMREA